MPRLVRHDSAARLLVTSFLPGRLVLDSPYADGVVRIIDFGRAALRPPMSDLARLAAQDFARDPALEAIGTAVWAHQVGDDHFEAQGHLVIADALSATG